MLGFSPQDWHNQASDAAQRGDWISAMASLKNGLSAYPDAAMLWHGAGSVLLSQGKASEAAEHFGKAHELEPKQFDHAVDQSIALSQAGDNEAALEILKKIEKKGARFAHYCSTRANAERGADDRKAAAIWYDRALKIEPARPKALAGRASVALERAEPKAARRFDRALAIDPASPALLLGKAQAQEVEGDEEGAFETMKHLVQQAPDFAEGLRYFAQLRRARGDDDFAAHYAQASKISPRNPAIPDSWCKTLAALELTTQACEVAAQARDRGLDEGHFALLEAVYAGASGDNDRAEAIFAAMDDRTVIRRANEARHRVRRGELDQAETLLASVLEQNPLDIDAWALRDIVWRLMDDRRAQWLHEQAGLIQFRPLAAKESVLKDSLKILRELHAGSANPLGQSLRGGTQTRGVLFHRMEPALGQLKQAILRSIEEYRSDLPDADPDHPLLSRRDANWQITGSWSVRLTGGGDHHASHIHPEGVVSSALYLAVPDDAAQDDKQPGWLELGRPPRDLNLDLPPLRTIKPEPGHLALFPSTLYHGTTAFSGSEPAERLTVAFDVSTR